MPIFGNKNEFAIQLWEGGESNGLKEVDVWCDSKRLTCDDNEIYVPAWLTAVKSDLEILLREGDCCCFPFGELTPEDNYRKVVDSADLDDVNYRFMDWGPTSDNVISRIFREENIVYITFSFWRDTHHKPADLGKVFCAKMEISELRKILFDSVYELLWTVADFRKAQK